MIKKLLSFLLYILILFLCHESFAAPVIDTNGVSGTLSDTSQITITGSSFGDAGPTISIFEDFSGHTDGSAPDASATIGSWDDGDPPTSYNCRSDSKLSNDIGWASVDGDGYGIIEDQFTATNEIFVSAIAYVPDGYQFPGTSSEETFGTSGNMKTHWIMYSNDGYSASGDFDLWFPSLGNTDWRYLSSNDGGSCHLSTSEQGGSQSLMQWVWDYPVRWSLWIYGNGTSAAGSDGMWQAVGPNGMTVNDYAGGINGGSNGWFCSSHNQYTFDRIKIAGYWSGGGAGDRFLHDDIYVAIGPNAAARIEVGDHSTYTSCTKLAIATVDSWSASTIIATVREGGFSSGDTVYIFVIDANNDWSTGDGPYTFGDTIGTDTTAPAVSGRVTMSNTRWQ